MKESLSKIEAVGLDSPVCPYRLIYEIEDLLTLDTAETNEGFRCLPTPEKANALIKKCTRLELIRNTYKQVLQHIRNNRTGTLHTLRTTHTDLFGAMRACGVHSSVQAIVQTYILNAAMEQIALDDARESASVLLPEDIRQKRIVALYGRNLRKIKASIRGAV